MPRPVSIDQPRQIGQVRACDVHDVRSMRGQHPPADRTSDNPRQVQDANARQWPLAGGKPRGGASPIRVILTSGCIITAWPCLCASHSAKIRMAVAHKPILRCRVFQAKAGPGGQCVWQQIAGRSHSQGYAGYRPDDAGNWCAGAPSVRRRIGKFRQSDPTDPLGAAPSMLAKCSDMNSIAAWRMSTDIVCRSPPR